MSEKIEPNDGVDPDPCKPLERLRERRRKRDKKESEFISFELPSTIRRTNLKWFLYKIFKKRKK
ncbi:MAG: hypothetical protein FK730_08225 [Asgard group archaeon]|nr:hypothetical protein [Asgard group archaeon]